MESMPDGRFRIRTAIPHQIGYIDQQSSGVCYIIKTKDPQEFKTWTENINSILSSLSAISFTIQNPTDFVPSSSIGRLRQDTDSRGSMPELRSIRRMSLAFTRFSDWTEKVFAKK